MTAAKNIRIARKLAFTVEVPFDEEHYGGLDIEGACQQEEQMEQDEILQLLAEGEGDLELIDTKVTIVEDPA